MKSFIRCPDCGQILSPEVDENYRRKIITYECECGYVKTNEKEPTND